MAIRLNRDLMQTTFLTKGIFFVIAALALLASAGSSLATDLASHKAAPLFFPPPPPPIWTGFYVGVNTGYTWMDSNVVNTTAFPGPCSLPLCDAPPPSGVNYADAASGIARVGAGGGFLGGGQIGYNFLFATNFLAGIESTLQGMMGSSQTGSFARYSPVPGFPQFPFIGVGLSYRSIDYIGTVGARVGYLLTPSLLVYGTGGLAYGGVNASTSIFAHEIGFAPTDLFPAFTAGRFSRGRVGWTAGGGVEWMFWPNWSAKVEILYYNLGTVTYNIATLAGIAGPTSPGPGLVYGSAVPTSTTRFNGHIVRAGVNYHFNLFDPAALVTSY